MDMRLPKLQTCFTLAAVLLLCLIVRLLWISRCGDMALFDGGGSGGGGRQHRASNGQHESGMIKRDDLVVKDAKSGKTFTYHNEMPLVFIGGFPRSGTTLMRAMLDAHPDVRCGEETRVIPRILGMRAQWKRNDKEWRRLLEAGVTDHVLDSAISSFILEVMAKHAQPAPRLCNKDPFALKSTEYLSQLFPQSKFVLMIRDGRATVHSMISRGVTVTGFDLKNPRQCLEKWNQAISQMYHQCYLVGDTRCYPMYYEQLVLHPEKHMRDLLQFLGLPWNNSVLHHEMFIGKEISLSKTEKSTDQVVKPVNTDALTAWVGKFPQEVVRDMSKIAPMLAHLGYDPDANPPDYGRADDFVLRKTEDLHKNKQYWEKKVAEVYNQTGKPTALPTEGSNEAPTSYYVNAGMGVVANRTLPKVTNQAADGDGRLKKRKMKDVGDNEEKANAGDKKKTKQHDNEESELNNQRINDESPVDLEAMKFTLPPAGVTMKLEDDTN